MQSHILVKFLVKSRNCPAQGIWTNAHAFLSLHVHSALTGDGALLSGVVSRPPPTLVDGSSDSHRGSRHVDKGDLSAEGHRQHGLEADEFQQQV